MNRFATCFKDLPDPRGRNTRHPLMSILFIAIAAIVCGAESCADMADFGVSKKKWLKTIVPLPYGIPGHGTFSTVFRCLNQVAFEAALPKPLQRASKAWWRSTARRYEATPLPLVKVGAAGCGLVIAQQTSPRRNEVQGVLEALALLSLEGAIVTADALHCRADTARAILSAGGDYAWR